MSESTISQTVNAILHNSQYSMSADFFARIRTDHGIFTASNGVLDLLVALTADRDDGWMLFETIAKCQPRLCTDHLSGESPGTALLTIKGCGESSRVHASYRDEEEKHPFVEYVDFPLSADVEATIAIGFEQSEKGELVFVLIAER